MTYHLSGHPAFVRAAAHLLAQAGHPQVSIDLPGRVTEAQGGYTKRDVGMTRKDAIAGACAPYGCVVRSGQPLPDQRVLEYYGPCEVVQAHALAARMIRYQESLG
jgi:hypothetical protein